MNVSVPQLVEAGAELRELMKVENCIISPQTSRPIITLVQDCVTSVYLMTLDDSTVFSSRHAMQMYSAIKRPRRPYDVRRRRGRDLFMALLPPAFTRLSSPITSRNVGAIIQDLFMNESPQAASEFLSDAQRLGMAYLDIRGFTVGLRDTFDYVRPVTQSAPPAIDARTEGELEIISRLSGHSSELGKAAADAQTPENNIRIMLDGGGKGKPANIMQGSACVGQQIIDGTRPTCDFDAQRCLPHFTAEETATLPQARGFVNSCLRDGLNAQEYFFTAQGGREGMTDTSCKSVTGDTELLVYENGVPTVVQIGHWIDDRLRKCPKSEIHVYPEDRNLELLRLEGAAVAVPTVDAHGSVTVAEVSAICRHSGDGFVHRIMTASGRSVRVPESKSLIVWDDSAFVEKDVSDLQIGSLLPSVAELYLPSGNRAPPAGDDRRLGTVLGIFTVHGICVQTTSQLVLEGLSPQQQQFLSAWCTDGGITHSAAGTKVIIDDPLTYIRFSAYFRECGARRENRRLPPIVYCADAPLLLGFLHGYFSAPAATAAPPPRIAGLELFLARFSIFSTVSPLTGAVVVAAQSDGALRALLATSPLPSAALDKSQDVSFPTVKHIRLDAVVEITRETIPIHEKLYDITVPSTLNFVLANGLGVRDTTETGHLTRRQTKLFENLIVSYDGSVRDDSGHILQFKYGGDGFDPCRLVNGLAIRANLPPGCKHDREMLALCGENYTTRAYKLPVDIVSLAKYFAVPADAASAETYESLETAVERAFADAEFRSPILSAYVVSNLLHLCRTGVSIDIPGILQRTATMLAKAVVSPGEAVGTLAAQSWGQVATQASLNSVDGATELLFLIDGSRFVRTTIGEYVDAQIAAADASQMEYHPNNTEFAWLRGDVKILAGGEDGSVDWQSVRAVTRHPVVTKKLLEVTLQSGRVIRATAAKSFVTIDKGTRKLVPTRGCDLKVGDAMPVALAFPPHGFERKYLDIKKYLSPTNFAFSSNVHRMIELSMKRSSTQNTSGISPVVFAQSVTLGCPSPLKTFNSVVRRFGPKTKNGAITSARMKQSCVYTQSVGESAIPENLELDRDFGWLCGIYVAEGCIGSDPSSLQIAGIETEIQQNIKRVVGKWGIQCNVHGGTFTGVSNKVLSNLLFELFGHGAANKRIHPDLLMAPNEWVAGFLSGYIDGNGFIGPSYIKCSSISKSLTRDIAALAARFGALAQFSVQPQKLSFGGNFLSNEQNIVTWRLVASNRLRDILQLSLKRKATALADVLDYTSKKLEDYYGDTYADKIKSIVEIDWTDKVYDLTVDGFKTFNNYENVVLYDTFHYAGLGVSVISVGFVRLQKLYNASRKAKNVSRVFFKGGAQFSRENAFRVAHSIKPITLRAVLVAVDAHYGVAEEDRGWIAGWRDVFGDTLCAKMFPSLYSRLCLRLVHTSTAFAQLAAARIKELFGNVFLILQCGVIVLLFVHRLAFLEDSEHTPAAFMERLSDSLPESVLLCGVPGITRIHVARGFDKGLQAIGAFATDDQCGGGGEYFLEVEGGAIGDMVCAEPSIDERRSYSSNPVVACAQMGIEGCTAVLRNELNRVVDDTSYIDSHHVSIVVDFMTHTGELKPINRHTQNGLRTSGPLERATNEQSLHVLTDAAVNCRQEKMAGISAQIMAGKRIRVGTGLCDVMQPFVVTK